jgi:hypothetical protein
MTTGYVKPVTPTQFPKQLNLSQFLQTVIVGLSNLDGTLVVPKWQVEPPKDPELEVEWISFGIVNQSPDANAYVAVDANGNNVFQRHEGIELGLSIYGPGCNGLAGLIRDGFSIYQNLEALRAANMGFTKVGPALVLPELINERWRNKVEMSVFLRREIQRVYPVLTLISANGQIHSFVGNEAYLENFQTQT